MIKRADVLLSVSTIVPLADFLTSVYVPVVYLGARRSATPGLRRSRSLGSITHGAIATLDDGSGTDNIAALDLAVAVAIPLVNSGNAEDSLDDARLGESSLRAPLVDVFDQSVRQNCISSSATLPDLTALETRTGRTRARQRTNTNLSAKSRSRSLVSDCTSRLRLYTGDTGRLTVNAFDLPDGMVLVGDL
jgi:hypothetical protein